MASPTAPVPRRTRWVQGLIIAASAVVIIFAAAAIASRDAKPTDETSPSVQTSPSVVLSICDCDLRALVTAVPDHRADDGGGAGSFGPATARSGSDSGSAGGRTTCDCLLQEL